MGRRKEIPNLIKKVMLVLAGIQVVLGGIWLICNWNQVPDYQETRDLLKASETLVVDEYMGILYPIILRLFSVMGKGFCVPLYLLQLIVAVGSYYCLLDNVAKGVFPQISKKYLWLFAGYLVTFPMILQCHMSVLPYSLASSLLVFMVVQIRHLAANREQLQKKRLLLICVLWLIVGLLIPDYGMIATFLVVSGLVFVAWKKRKRILLYLCMVVLTITTLTTILSQVQIPGSYGRMQRSVNSVLLTRFVWPYFGRDVCFWDHRKWIEFEAGELAWVSMYPENVFYQFGPKVESIIGREEANIVYGQMVKETFFVGKKEELKSLARDVLANAGGPFAIQYHMSGRGVSYTGWNYYQMQGNAPGLTKYFVKFSMYSFMFMFVLSVWIGWSKRKSWKIPDSVKKAVPALLGLGVMVLWYTLVGNGMQDYLKVLPVLLFWCLLPMLGLGVLVREKPENSAE